MALNNVTFVGNPECIDERDPNLVLVSSGCKLA